MSNSLDEYLKAKYQGVWSSKDGFMLWESTDGKLLQLTGPEGEAIILVRKEPTRAWFYPEER